MNQPQDDIREVFQAWYETDMPSLYRYIWYQVGEQTAAEELTAQVCERALHILDRYEAQRGSFKAWMFGIARNEVRQAMRSFARQPDFLALDDLPDLRAEGLSVEHHYQRQEMQRLLMQYVSDLPERDRDLIALSYGAGFSHAEISALTDMTENHVAVTLHRAIQKLRDAMQNDHVALVEQE